MDTLPVETLQHIGSFLPFTERCTTFPLVCKAFAEAASCRALGDLWAIIALDAPPQAAGSKPQPLLQSQYLLWLAARASQVQHLRVECRALPSTPGSFVQLLGAFRGSASLHSLEVTGCEGITVAAALPILPSFGNLEVLRIEELDWFCNQGITLQALSSMTTLRSLTVTLREGFLHSWPDLTRMHRLKTLDMRGCPAYEQPWAAWAPLPGWMTKLTSLRSLSIGCAGFTEVPPVITALTQLTRLAIEDSCLSASACAAAPAGQLPAGALLPVGFHRLTNLKSLSLGNWSGGSVPDEICALTNLEELSWRGELPCDVGGCDGDDYTDDYTEAPNQALRDFALPKGFDGLRKLRTLTMDCHTGMTELPPQILELTALESLNLSNTGLSSLPGYLHNLPNLASLRLASCSFARLPAAVFGVPSLRHLDLSRNPELELGDLSRAQLSWLASLGSLGLAKLGDIAWERPSLDALAFLEAAAAQQRRLSRDFGFGQAVGFSTDTTGERGQSGDDRSDCGGICVLERVCDGCASVGVRAADGQLVHVPLRLCARPACHDDP